MRKNLKFFLSLTICVLLVLTITSTILAQDSTYCREGDTSCTSTSQSSTQDDITTKPPCSELEPEGNGVGETDPTSVTRSGETTTRSANIATDDGDCGGEPDDITTGD